MENINHIKKLVIKFKKGIEKAKDKGLLKTMPFRNFPRACCGDASDLLSQYLLNNKITSKSVSGTYWYDDFDNVYSHAWIEVDGKIIIDITCGQYIGNPIFGEFNIKDYYIGTINTFYNLFEIECYEEFIGLHNYGKEYYERLNEIYKIILENID